MTHVTGPVLVVVPAFGQPHLTDTVLDDLLDQPGELVPDVRVVVVDNAGDYEPRRRDTRLSVHRSGTNLRWIGSANWAVAEATSTGCGVCVVLNNDVRLSPDFLHHLVRTFDECDDVAVAAACYDDFWLHQRARVIPLKAVEFEPVHAYRQVPFCDGTAIGFSVAAMTELGPLDTAAFPRHGYGSDIDLALRARTAGMRCVVTDSAFVSHLRRGTMDRLPDESSERNRAEILAGMDAKWGADWRARVGLGPNAFPPHNTGSGASWYLPVEGLTGVPAGR